jgi:hypothetical protein
MSTIDRMKIMKLIIMEIYIIIYIIIIKNNYTMTKLWLMISHMYFVTNQWNVPHHWHIIDTACPKQFVRNDFKTINHFCPLWLKC